MITITKKESLFLSVYHTVWMHKAKTARLVITLYRHITDKLSTSYRHITNCRPTVGRLIVYVLGKTCRPLSPDKRPTDGRQTANKWPTVGRQMADKRPTVGRQVFWELFFTITVCFLTGAMLVVENSQQLLEMSSIGLVTAV